MRYKSLILGYRHSLLETVLRFSLIVRGQLEQEFTFEAIQLWRVPTFIRGVHERQRFRECRQSCIWLS
jgi:hypothetical protein